MSDVPPFRRPSEKWCIETAIWLLQIGTRDSDALIDGKRLLDPGDGDLLVRAAAALDRYGQRRAARARSR